MSHVMWFIPKRQQNPTMEFSWYDYLIFLSILILSTAVGIYYGCFGERQSTVNKYLLGGKKMTPFPVAISVTVGHFSAITLLGFSADVYKYGAYYIFACLSMVLLALMTIYFYYSVFFDLKITSLYEYLELRFDNKTRLLGSVLYVISDTLMLPIIAYLPSLALSDATGIHVNWIFILTCGVCVFYTAIGGLKTVVWTDFHQLGLIFVSLISVLVISFISSGSSVIWNKAVEGGRFDIFDLDLDPTKRDSLWTYLIGFTFYWTYHVSLGQGAVQKYLALPTFKDCVKCVVYFMFAMMLVILFCVSIGLAMYAKYADCDPVINNKLKKHDQVVLYYVMDIGRSFPGVQGLFIIALFCASLSSISSTLNALSGVIYSDFVIRCFGSSTKEKRAVSVLKLIVIVLGVIVLSLTFLVKYMGDLVPLVLSLPALAGGPIMGMFTLGVLFPRANSEGTFWGVVCGLVFTSSLILPLKFGLLKPLDYPSKDLSVTSCRKFNGSVAIEYSIIENLTKISDKSSELPFLFRVSPFYYTVMGTIVTMLVGLTISYATKKEDVEEKCISPLCRSLLRKELQSQTAASLLQNTDTLL